MNKSRIVAVFAVALLAAVSAFANDRENFSVGRLVVETDVDLTGGTISNGTASGMTSTSETMTDPTINGRAAVLSSSATAERVIETGSGATNAQIIVFTTPFTGNPVVSVFAQTWAATNLPCGTSALNPTNATLAGFGAGGLSWIAIGTK